MIIFKFIYYRLFFLFQSTKKLFLLKSILGGIDYLNDLAEWKARNFDLPTPQFIKNSIFLKHSDSDVVWIETGTYRGTTTKFLAKKNKHVHTIEPEKGFYEDTKNKLINKGFKNISFYFGTSEDKLSEVLNNVINEKVFFWLDGHFSGSGTFQGDVDSPIIKELELIQEYLPKLNGVKIFIDDIREFDSDNLDYPSKQFLIDWVNTNKLKWEILFDMMIIY